MNVEVSSQGPIVILTLSGDVDMSNTAAVITALQMGVDPDSIGVVVDLTAVHYLDSAGVQMLFDVARRLDTTRRSFGLVVPEDSPVRTVVKITHLHEAAALCPSVLECVDALNEGAGRRE